MLDLILIFSPFHSAKGSANHGFMSTIFLYFAYEYVIQDYTKDFLKKIQTTRTTLLPEQ